MLYREIPKTGDKISALGFGCMRLASKAGRIDEKKAEEQIRNAVDKGVNYLDTAYFYHNGASEKFLGKLLSDKDFRKKVKVATKLPPWSVKTTEDMDRILDEQLEKLQVETIDYYLIHGIMAEDVWERLKALGVVDFLKRAKEAGKIKHIGFSFHSDINTFKKIVDDYPWEFCQIQYNFLDENNQAGKEGLEYAAKNDLGVVIMEPLRGGNLTNKIPKKVQKEWDASPVKRSPAEWALKWIWNHPEVTCILSGMGLDEHVKENLRVASETEPNSMTKDEVERVSRVRDIYFDLTKINCTACAYCMPCPAGVNIPNCFDKYNDKYMFGGMGPKMYYLFQCGAVMSDKPSKASQCTGCGLCEKHCPQHIEIRKELKNVSKELEGIFDKPIEWVAKKVMK